MNHARHNPWKGFILGTLGATVGVVAMRSYWKAIRAVTGSDPRSQSGNPDPAIFDSISLIGKHHEQGESSTAAMGRNAYRLITGHDPESQETRTTLSYIVHWSYSMLMGGVYGAVRGRASMPDVKGSLALGLGVWLFGDELGTPLLGFASGPTSSPLRLHAHAFAAHIAYGVGTAAATQALHRIV